MNLYAYVGNDPVNRTDPTGKFLQFIIPIVIGITVSAPANAPAPGQEPEKMGTIDAISSLSGPAKAGIIVAKAGSEIAKDVAKSSIKGAEKVFSKEKQALVEMAKHDKKMV